MKVIKVSVGVLVTLAVVAAVAVAVALRDSPARDAIGMRGQATSGEAVISYFTAGPRGRAVVVLLPSYSRSVSDLNELAGDLHEAGYQTIGVQPRGIDGSTLPELGISLHTLSDDVVAVLDTEGITEPVHILGHAYGNRIARTFATDYPERTASLVLLAAGGVEPTPPETGKAISQALFGIGSSASRKEAVHFAFFAKASSVPDHWLRGFYPMAGLAQARAMTNTRPEEWSAGGDARILVLEPSEDAAASGGGELLRAAHPHRVTLIRVDNAGHALLPEQPDVVAREVIGYLGETL